MEKEQNAILETIDIIVKKRLKNLGFNYYVDGVIQTDNNDGTYNVLINGTPYNNVSSKHKFIYSVGDTVQILIKNGNWKKKYIDDKSRHNNHIISQQYKAIDGTGKEFPLICHNGDNIWVGAFKRASRHHEGKGTYGKLFISTGYNNDLKKGNETAYISVPNETNTEATNYKIMHQGNQLNYIYPTGSIYISSTNSNPSSVLGGTWQLIDKEFISTTSNMASMFTINDEVTTSATPSFSRSNHAIYTRINFVNKIELSDTAYTIGTFNLEQLGVTELTYQKYGVAYSDGGNAVFMVTLTDKGALTVVDVVGKQSVTTIPADSSCWVEFVHEIQSKSMLDDACNRFYWQRTA